VSKEKKITMQEIADKVGVSKFAVSKALSGKPGISAATREKIFLIASQYGYFNHKAKAKLQNKITAHSEEKMVGILIPDIRSQNKESAYWGRILDGISKSLDNIGVGTVIITDDSPQNFNRVIKPEGLLGVICVGLISTPLLLELRNLSIPFVLVDHEDQMLTSDSIFMNSFDSIRKLTNHLLGLGHTNIQFIGDIRYSRSFFDRWCGYKSVMDENHLPHAVNKILIQISPSTDEINYNFLMSELVNMSTEAFPTAFVCANDQIAFNVLRALSELKIRVPEDCSLTGFDNNDDILKHFPEITTVNAEKEALGTKAVNLLFSRLENSQIPYEKVLLQSELIIRGSTAAPKN
jgi:LacI family transcriptional regulator